MNKDKKFSKDMLVKHYPKYVYVLKVLLKDNKSYTIKECEDILTTFLNKEVK